MVTVKITLIPFNTSKYFDKFLDEYNESRKNKKRTFIDTVEWVKKRHLNFFIEELKDFDNRFNAKIKKGLIEFTSNDWQMDLRTLMGDYIMSEVANIEIVR